jgi:hypothetical protein
MYTLDVSGRKVPLGKSPDSSEGFKFFGDSDNKAMLYMALVVAALVAMGGAYLVYKHFSSSKKESFGYRL